MRKEQKREKNSQEKGRPQKEFLRPGDQLMVVPLSGNRCDRCLHYVSVVIFLFVFFFSFSSLLSFFPLRLYLWLCVEETAEMPPAAVEVCFFRWDWVILGSNGLQTSYVGFVLGGTGLWWVKKGPIRFELASDGFCWVKMGREGYHWVILGENGLRRFPLG